MGVFNLTTDQKTKIVRGEWIGKFDVEEWNETFERSIVEIKKFPKGESMALGVSPKIDVKLLTPAMSGVLNDFIEFASQYCRKVASVVPSFMFQKSMRAAADYTTTNNRMFVTEQEAMKWLLEG